MIYIHVGITFPDEARSVVVALRTGDGPVAECFGFCPVSFSLEVDFCGTHWHYEQTICASMYPFLFTFSFSPLSGVSLIAFGKGGRAGGSRNWRGAGVDRLGLGWAESGVDEFDNGAFSCGWHHPSSSLSESSES